MKTNRHTASDGLRLGGSALQSAFSLIELLVVMSILTVITVGLMAMFGQVQKAFLGSVTQTDVLESGRATSELLSRELAGVVPSYEGNVVNFFAYTDSTPTYQKLPGNGNVQSNILELEKLYFLTRENQAWTGYGYQVVATNGVGTLYRSVVSTHVSLSPVPLLNQFLNLPANSPELHRVMDGVVEFRVRAYDADGRWITANLTNNVGFLKSDIKPSGSVPGEFDYVFSSNAVPAYVEFEIGVLEKRTYERFKALPSGPPGNNPQEKYLRNHVGQTHLFRQRVPVRMVDVTAYQ